MSKKRRNFTADFKAKLVLELLEDDKTLNEIASKYNITSKKPTTMEKTVFSQCFFSI
jgi:putative transposase